MGSRGDSQRHLSPGAASRSPSVPAGVRGDTEGRSRAGSRLGPEAFGGSPTQCPGTVLNPLGGISLCVYDRNCKCFQVFKEGLPFIPEQPGLPSCNKHCTQTPLDVLFRFLIVPFKSRQVPACRGFCLPSALRLRWAPSRPAVSAVPPGGSESQPLVPRWAQWKPNEQLVLISVVI